MQRIPSKTVHWIDVQPKLLECGEAVLVDLNSILILLIDLFACKEMECIQT